MMNFSRPIHRAFSIQKVLWLLALVLLRLEPGGLAASPATVLSATSPDGRIEVRITSPASNSGEPAYRVFCDGQELLKGKLGLCISGTNVLEKAVLKSSHLRESDSTYSMPFGKSNPIRNHYRELVLDWKAGPAGPLRTLRMIFRAYDDGVAYRYFIPKQHHVGAVEVTDEPGMFQFEGDPQLWPLYFKSYVNSHEGLYNPASFSQLITNRLIDVPLLAEMTNGVSVAVAQADLHNYAGLYLRAEQAGGGRWLRCDLSPLPGQPGVRVRSGLPLASPWRVFLIGTAPGRLVESELLLNLNRPNAIGRAPWLKAGKTTFYWWSGVQEPVDPKAAFEWEKHYIDFCARHSIAFHAVIGTQGDHPWYYQTKAGYNPPGPDADVTRPRPGFPMEQLVKYAHSKGVGIRVWVHWKPLSGHLDAAFAQYQKWGLSGVMVDFLDHNDQQMVHFYNQAVRSAARHHLDINFHGIWAPTGLERTYPNLFNHEGVLNLEYLKGTRMCTPGHDVTVAFTRMLAGPLDYHLGGFRGSYRAGFKPRSVRPIIFGTRCHQLAMYVVFENPLPMVCDTPDSYKNQPGFDFLCEVPTTWDETRVLDGRVGNYIVVARRKGRDWYVGAMTDWTARSISVPLHFLPAGDYRVESWADAPDSTDPNRLVFGSRRMSAGDTLQMRLNSGGGQVLRIAPIGD